MCYSLFEYAYKAKLNDPKCLEYLINKFQPLLIKYANKFSDFEDSKSELTLHLIGTIYKLPLDSTNFKQDKYIISYINKSIINHYYLLKKKSVDPIIDYCVNSQLSLTYTDKSNLIFYDLINNLNVKEKLILEKKYIYNYTNSEIAKYLNVSRQNIQACLTRAILKLKDTY